MEKTFIYSSRMPGTAAQLAAVHAHPKAFSKLAMPPLIMQIINDQRSSLTEGSLAFRMWFGPVPVNWLARHAEGSTPDSFKDIQVSGPMKSWSHEHIFESDAEGARLIDKVVYSHKPGLAGLLTRLLFDGLPLRMLFIYRHWQTRRMLKSKEFVSGNTSLESMEGA